MGICAGLDLCEDHIGIHLSGDETAYIFPAVICREKKDEIWYIGEEAYRTALSGRGVLTDKLLKLMMKDGTATIMRRQYTGTDLVTALIRTVLSERLSTTDFSCIDRLMVALPESDEMLMNKVKEACVRAGIGEDRLTLISHEEAFVYYTLSQDKDIYANLVGMFDLSDERLKFYEMMVVRGLSKPCVVAEGTDTQEGFHLDILKKDSGKTLADRIITDVAKRVMDGKVYSSVFLTGAGFEKTDWAGGFTSFVCRKRRVLYEKGIFAIGASIAAEDMCRNEGAYPYMIFCDSRTKTELSMDVSIHDRAIKVILCPAGERWYGLCAHAEVIPSGQEYIELKLDPVDSSKEPRSVRIPLQGIPEIFERPDRCSRLSVDVYFTGAENVNVEIKDMGFGDFFRPSQNIIREEIVL
ncbi:MAG: DUF5716 family protein [Eubacteriales bacterium]|nr:DUF5716 family protein [Eubacteriales bacterium]